MRLNAARYIKVARALQGLSRISVRSMVAAVSMCLVIALHAQEQYPPPLKHTAEDHPAEHIILLNVEGLHALDLDTYVAAHPLSALAELSTRAVVYSNAHLAWNTEAAGLLALVTGGTPLHRGLHCRTNLHGPIAACEQHLSPGARTRRTYSMGRKCCRNPITRRRHTQCAHRHGAYANGGRNHADPGAMDGVAKPAADRRRYVSGVRGRTGSHEGICATGDNVTRAGDRARPIRQGAREIRRDAAIFRVV